eukprot:gb/GEZN01015166.1/.p1 GENE.gb/GEZN01015166.1/~~gb/GEZN01015166.1/.p1  ORF type:complete len:158 (+),score=16.08 gb/GEZN01015166.1/:47-520(+)
MEAVQATVHDMVPTDGHLELKHKRIAVLGMAGILEIVCFLSLIGVINYPDIGDKNHEGLRIAYVLVVAATSGLGLFGAYTYRGDLLIYFMYLMLFFAALNVLGLILDIIHDVHLSSFIWDVLVGLAFLLTASFANALRVNSNGYTPITGDMDHVMMA